MMRPTAASASKTHDKPASPPHKPIGKAPAIALQKGKKKVEEVTSKAKVAVTNGDHDKPHDDESLEDTTAGASESQEPATEVATAGTATPVQEADASTAELQTPHFEGETIH